MLLVTRGGMTLPRQKQLQRGNANLKLRYKYIQVLFIQY